MSVVPVSYTHLDVYKRQADESVRYGFIREILSYYRLEYKDENEFIGNLPVSYTHLDVYKRQGI